MNKENKENIFMGRKGSYMQVNNSNVNYTKVNNGNAKKSSTYCELCKDAVKEVRCGRYGLLSKILIYFIIVNCNHVFCLQCIKEFRKPKILRNWELQFVGEANEVKLHEYIYDQSLQPFIDANVVRKFESLFHHEPIKYSHALSMLLTLSVFTRLKST